LGVIVACIPTLAPLFKACIQPAMTWLTGPSGKSSTAHSGQRNIVTIGGSGAPKNRRNRGSKSCPGLDEEHNLRCDSVDEVRLTKMTAMNTKCRFDPEDPQASKVGVHHGGGIMVRKTSTPTPAEGGRRSRKI